MYYQKNWPYLRPKIQQLVLSIQLLRHNTRKKKKKICITFGLMPQCNPRPPEQNITATLSL